MRLAPLITVLAVGLVLFSINLGGYDLWPPDEPRFGQVAREMLASHDIIHLSLNGYVYREKPPLLFWLIAVVSLPFGDVTETTARIPSVISALVVLYFTYLLALRLYGARVAFCACFVLMTTSLFWWEARNARTDMLLTACLTAALYAFWMHHENRERRWLLWFYFAVTAALYAKGPPALVFAILLPVAFYWRRREQRRALHLVWGLSAVVALIALWLIPAYVFGPKSAEGIPHASLGDNLYRQIIGRFFLGVSKQQPPWYYITNFPVDIVPWTLFLPWVIYFAWKRRREGDAIRLLLCWIIPAFIFFSISSGKRSVYLLPLYPACAILIGYSLVTLMDAPRLTWLRRTTAAVWAILLLSAGILFPVLAYFAWFDTTLEPDFGAYVPGLAKVGIAIDKETLAAVAVFCGSALAYGIHAIFVAVRREGRTLPYAIAAHFAGLALVSAWILFPIVNNYKGARAFCAPLRTMTDAGTEYRLYSAAFIREEYTFYTKHQQIPVLVELETMDMAKEPDPDLLQDFRGLQSGLHKAVMGVRIDNWQAVSSGEIEALSRACTAFLAFARTKSQNVERLANAIEASLKNFAQELNTSSPVFIFVQEEDWRWILGLKPEFQTLPILNSEGVGSRSMLLIANGAGAEAIARVANTAPRKLAATVIPSYCEESNAERHYAAAD